MAAKIDLVGRSKEQSANRRNVIMLSTDGETLPMFEWARRLGVSPTCLRLRLKRGWSVDRTLSAGGVVKGAGRT